MQYKGKKWYIEIWSDERYIDLWSSTHFLMGGVIAGISVLASVNFWISVVIMFILLFLWEWYENFKKLHETINNKVLDIALGLIGYALIYIVMNLEIFNNIILFIVVAASFLILDIWGTIAYKMGSSDDFLKKFRSKK